MLYDHLLSEINMIPEYKYYGRVSSIIGIMVEILGIERVSVVGTPCIIYGRNETQIRGEIIGFREGKTLAMCFASLDGVGLGCLVEVKKMNTLIFPSNRWLGRVIDAVGEPMDEKGPLIQGEVGYSLKSLPPNAYIRNPVEQPLDMGVKAINTFLTCCQGQRMGIFSGSGVGKSTLLSMLARHSNADVNVIGLIGERGREVNEFLTRDLKEGLAKSIVIVATSDLSPLMRRQAAYLTLTLAEYFRDQGLNVLCLLDSITRFAMAQREIGLSVGEPPTQKGYTPSVFSELPKILERAGPGPKGAGDITAFFTVLVEGDDTNEPISDTVRGILDGHIILERQIAERGRFPSINILKSLSRTVPGCHTIEQNALVHEARRLLSRYEDMAELIRIGAYKRGTDPEIDRAIKLYEPLEYFLTQMKEELYTINNSFEILAQILHTEE